MGVTIGVSCKKCISPSIEDIFHYTTSPFLDLLKQNKYYYCISYAQEKSIVQGYSLDATGKTQCQDGKVYSSAPFCPANNITRIEAVAVLLRQAGLWNESLNNSSYAKNMTFSDVDAYWYGYAQKAVEAGLIVPDNSGKLSPNEYITRKEFVTMASKIFTINMCSLKDMNSSISDFASDIKIFDKEHTPTSSSVNVTTFPNRSETMYDFSADRAGDIQLPFSSDWTFTNTTTGEQKSMTGEYLDNFELGSAGLWVVKLVTTYRSGQSSVSYQQISISGSGMQDTAGISLQIGVTNNGNIS